MMDLSEIDDPWGVNDPGMMPRYFFPGALRIHHDTAVRADVKRQNFRVCPRFWYIDANFSCGRCGQSFTWTAQEQKAWFEEYFFYIDAWPRHCRSCREQNRRVFELRREYNATVAAARNHGTMDHKRRIVGIVSELEQEQAYQESLEKITGRRSLFWPQVGERMIETKTLFQRQIARQTEANAAASEA